MQRLLVPAAILAALVVAGGSMPVKADEAPKPSMPRPSGR